MIKSVAKFPKEDGVPSLLMNNGLCALSENDWVIVSRDKILKFELNGDELTRIDTEFTSLKGRDILLVQFIKTNIVNILIGLENEIIISDAASGIQLFHLKLEVSEIVTNGFTKWESGVHNLWICTNKGRVIHCAQNLNDLQWELHDIIKLVDTIIWAICMFDQYLVISIESGALEFWRDQEGTWSCLKRIQSK